MPMEMADTEEGVTLIPKNLAWLEVHGWHCLDNGGQHYSPAFQQPIHIK